MALVTAHSLFVHVPKTGGSSVRAILPIVGIRARESGPFEVEDHYGLPELRAAHPGIDDGLLTFGFIRHPVAWLQSRWAWAVVTGFAAKTEWEPAAAQHWMAACWSDRFEEFAARYLERYPGIYTQTAFRMLGLWSERPADRIGRTENLIADLIDILDAAGEEFDAETIRACPRVKVAACGHLAERCQLTRDLQQRILRAEPMICERFGY
jgi:hypothetical protein